MKYQSRSVLCLGVLLLTVALAACGNLSEPASISGVFPLVSYAGQPLPVDQGAVPARAGPITCRILLDVGTLSLNAASGRFNLQLTRHDSCTGRVASTAGDEGLYWQVGKSLRFLNPEASSSAEFFGIVRDDHIAIDWYGSTALVFRR